MKRLHTLSLTLCMLCVCTLITAQQASTQDSKRVVIIKKKTDANGQQTVEKVIVTNGEEEEALAKLEAENAIAGDVVKNKICATSDMQVMVNVEDENGEKVITINVDGETETLRLAKGEELSAEDKARLEEKGVFLNHENGVTWVGKGHDKDFNFDFDFDFEGLGEGLVHLNKELAHLAEGHAWAFAGERDDINCAALGVYVSTANGGGVYVNSTIGSSGAEEAGLTSGDIIKYIDDDATANYRELHNALAKHEPGDVVTVTYSRDGVEDRVETELRAWKEFPSFANSRHAFVNCGEEPLAEETVTRKIIVIKKDKVDEAETPISINQSPVAETIDNNLALSDFVAFPNPTDGKFNVQFSAEAKPTIVSVFDAAGKEIFRDKLDHFNGYYNREIDLTSQARGGLILSVEQEGKSFTEQIVLH